MAQIFKVGAFLDFRVANGVLWRVGAFLTWMGGPRLDMIECKEEREHVGRYQISWSFA